MASTATRRQAHRKNKCLRPFECIAPIVGSLERYVPIQTQGRWDQRDIYRCLVGMAAERLSVHSFQKMVAERPCETSMRYHLEKLDMEHLIAENNNLLVKQVMDVLPKGKKCTFAIDATDDPYYGTVTPLNQDFVVGDRPKKSTTQFYRYITLYLVERDKNITLAALPVQREVPLLQYVKQLLHTIKDTGMKIKVLLLDRGFYSAKIIRYLQRQKIPHIMPIKRHSAQMKRLLSDSRRSRHVTYIMNRQKKPLKLKIAIAIKYFKGRYNKHGLRSLGYVVHGIDWKPQKVASVYRTRFSIEASYRMRNVVRPRTTTKSPTIRYLMALVSLLLKNIWVAIRWRLFAQIRRGPKRIDQDNFRFDHYRLFVWNSITQKLGFRSKIPIPGGG